MSIRTTLHIMGPDITQRTTLARLCFASGHHAEVYDSVEEFISYRSMTGLILLIDDTGGSQVEMTIAAMQRVGHWLPLVTIAENPDAQSVVRAMKSGALDFMVMPTDIAPINACIARVMAEAELLRAQHNRSAEARARLQRLSAREREVLDHLVDGASNKSIARMLDLSPRTVEIHRTKMMGKLGVRSAAEAVRMRFEAGGLEAA